MNNNYSENMNIAELTKRIALKELRDIPVIEEIKVDLESLYKYQEALCVLLSDRENADLNILRIGTILVYSVIGKILHGKEPKDFDNDDWRDILDNVADYGVILDHRRHTELIFELFAVYIDYSVDINKVSIKGACAKEIKAIASEIRNMTKMLEENRISEPDYVDRCLWLSFEAMIKLLAAYKTKKVCPEYALFIQAVADFSIQYGRLTLYKKELELINSYLEAQEKLNNELGEKYRNYLTDLQNESDLFNDLLDNAFCDDFDQRLRNSVTLARKAGVSEEKILDTQEKIDNFFMT